MRLDASGRQLTYCTNIHPANGWQQVLASLQAHAPALKARLAPDRPFGLGLRLSRAEVQELLCPESMRAFQQFLAAEGLYVALLNGYPYGTFSGAAVKSEVFAPDWRSTDRSDYTLELAAALAQLLPEDCDGGISTLPLSYKPWMASGESWGPITQHIVRVCEEMVRVRQRSGRMLHLDIEPEPDGLLENAAETIAFFRDRLLPEGAPILSHALEVSLSRAGDLLRDHIRVCFDACHFAVEYESPAQALAAFAAAGIRIGRAQLSCALTVQLPGDNQVLAQVESLCEPVYLHQVIERRPDRTLLRYRDLPEALAHAADGHRREWRTHFHVPLFTAGYGALGSTQDDLRSLLHTRPLPAHLEIETYTWAVLPPELRLPLVDSIEREYRWVLDELCTKP